MRVLAVLLMFLLGPAGIVPATARVQLLHQERSLYRNIYVTQNGDKRCMTFRYPQGIGNQSCKFLHAPDTLIFPYTRMQLSALFLNPNPKRILIIGEGGSTIPDALQQMCPDARIDVVELDGAVDSVAREYFGFRPGPKTRVFISDGRVFVKRIVAQKPNYDLVLLDAFEADYIPEHMLTREFLQEVKATMAANGVIVANTFSNSALYDHESVTYRGVFGQFFNLRLDNRIILGRKGGIAPHDLTKARWNAAALEAEFKKRSAPPEDIVRLLNPAIDWNTGARILTDQYSPSNLLNAQPSR
jgi:spermidine synthase